MSNENKQIKPDCPLIGEDGNIFHLVGIAAKTLKRNGMSAEASEMTEKVFGSGSYEEALGIILSHGLKSFTPKMFRLYSQSVLSEDKLKKYPKQ